MRFTDSGDKCNTITNASDNSTQQTRVSPYVQYDLCNMLFLCYDVPCTVHRNK